MKTYVLKMVESNKPEKTVQITDYQMDVLFLALRDLIENYENFDSDYLADEAKQDLAEARYLDRKLGELFV